VEQRERAVVGGTVVTVSEASGLPGPVAAPPPSRVGRNLPAALAVGGGLGAMMIATLALIPQAWVGIVAISVGVATWEVTTATDRVQLRLPLLPLLVGGQAMVWSGWVFGAAGVLDAFGATVLACMVWRLAAGAENYLRDTATSVFVAAWVPLCGSFAVLLLTADNGAARVATLMVGVACSDVGGYALGATLGRHPMVAAISPKKSWEGFAGSMLSGVVGGMLMFTQLLQASAVLGAVFGAVIVVVATIGDLVESQVKRDLGLKDMSELLPGHGGLMDRLDSVLPSAVVAWVLLSALL